MKIKGDVSGVDETVGVGTGGEWLDGRREGRVREGVTDERSTT